MDQLGKLAADMEREAGDEQLRPQRLRALAKRLRVLTESLQNAAAAANEIHFLIEHERTHEQRVLALLPHGMVRTSQNNFDLASHVPESVWRLDSFCNDE
jgi:hypothetical protein